MDRPQIPAVLATLTVVQKDGTKAVHQMDLFGLVSLIVPMLSSHALAHKELSAAVDAAAAYSQMHRKKGHLVCQHFNAITHLFDDYMSDIEQLVNDL